METYALLGDEAIALGAVDAGLSAAYGYPGTPSTEIMEYLQQIEKKEGKPLARWSANEKTAYEEALGASFYGKRTLVTMKHVGLNVAADAFMNSALLDIRGGLVIAIADDPGMHSSQNEQDSRYYAEFAHIPCFEPVNQQQAYDVMSEAFDLSEKLHVPVMVRLVTRLSHSRAAIKTSSRKKENPGVKAPDVKQWMLLPALARKQWHSLLKKEKEMKSISETTDWNPMVIKNSKIGVITSGLGKNYFLENLDQCSQEFNHLHIGYYPLPYDKINKIASSSETLIVIEEGEPLIEKQLRGILPLTIDVKGKLSGAIPREGELTPDTIRSVLGLSPKASAISSSMPLPGRPPQLCKGCPHDDTYTFIKEVVSELKESAVMSDIGCYALGALPPLQVPETIVCMGASITMAKGAAESGMKNVMAVLGDSTFFHSGLTGLVDCVADNVPVTILVLDNSTVGMTGGQETILPSERIKQIALGVGVHPDHVHVVNAHKNDHDSNTALLRKELNFNGVSLIIPVRECIEYFRKKRKAEKGDN
ncbi:MAG: indolepyruvate ferredoxin oxidoreductase [Spirochaetes bacterium]|nr:indolepyruvate ferredoxin oxidoreductase [Spirochaetota bacterium]MBN2770003.1 indolepyruvate ferredoxin oxidoreductase [Spirochaetota bacterium]